MTYQMNVSLKSNFPIDGRNYRLYCVMPWERYSTVRWYLRRTKTTYWADDTYWYASPMETFSYRYQFKIILIITIKSCWPRRVHLSLSFRDFPWQRDRQTYFHIYNISKISFSKKIDLVYNYAMLNLNARYDVDSSPRKF